MKEVDRLLWLGCFVGRGCHSSKVDGNTRLTPEGNLALEAQTSLSHIPKTDWENRFTPFPTMPPGLANRLPRNLVIKAMKGSRISLATPSPN